MVKIQVIRFITAGAAFWIVPAAGSGLAPAELRAPPPSTAILAPCRIESVAGEALCGSVEVPEDRVRRTGRRIALNLVVLKATGPDPAPDPLFVFVGGPGQAATADAADDARRFAAIRRSRDIVLIDQRGTGRSNPLACRLETPAIAIGALVAGEMSSDLVSRCRRALEGAADLRLYTTAIAADDIEEVRHRLGYGRINLYGGSYGSRAALVYMQRHPSRVRTATLRSVFPPDLRNPLNSARDAQRAFDLLAADCASDPGCASAYPNLAATFAAVLDRLERQPEMVALGEASASGEIAVTAPAFAGLVKRMLYTARGQAALPAMINRAAGDDFSMVRPALVQTLAMTDQLSLGMFLSVTCAEDVRFIRRVDLVRAGRASGRFGAGAARSLFEACRAWPLGVRPTLLPGTPLPDAPTLLLSGAADPVTPPAYAAGVARTLRNARTVVMSGEAHGPFSDCGIAMMTELVVSGNLPRADPPCVAQSRRPPFVIMPSSENARGS